MLHHCVSIKCCYLLTESFSCWVANTQATCSNKPPQLSKKFQKDWINPKCGPFKHNVGTEGQLAGNTCGSHGIKATIKYHGYHRTTYYIAIDTHTHTHTHTHIYIYIYMCVCSWIAMHLYDSSSIAIYLKSHFLPKSKFQKF